MREKNLIASLIKTHISRYRICDNLSLSLIFLDKSRKINRCMRFKEFIKNEAQIISILSKKIKMLKKKHGHVSKSMLTKKEWDQFTKDKK